MRKMSGLWRISSLIARRIASRIWSIGISAPSFGGARGRGGVGVVVQVRGVGPGAVLGELRRVLRLGVALGGDRVDLGLGDAEVVHEAVLGDRDGIGLLLLLELARLAVLRGVGHR